MSHKCHHIICSHVVQEILKSNQKQVNDRVNGVKELMAFVTDVSFILPLFYKHGKIIQCRREQVEEKQKT